MHVHACQIRDSEESLLSAFGATGAVSHQRYSASRASSANLPSWAKSIVERDNRRTCPKRPGRRSVVPSAAKSIVIEGHEEFSYRNVVGKRPKLCKLGLGASREVYSSVKTNHSRHESHGRRLAEPLYPREGKEPSRYDAPLVRGPSSSAKRVCARPLGRVLIAQELRSAVPRAALTVSLPGLSRPHTGRRD